MVLTTTKAQLEEMSSSSIFSFIGDFHLHGDYLSMPAGGLSRGALPRGPAGGFHVSGANHVGLYSFLHASRLALLVSEASC